MVNPNDFSDLGATASNPNDFSDLGGQALQTPQLQLSQLNAHMMDKLLNGAKSVTGSLFQGVLGAGDETRNLMASAINVIPGMHIPYVKSGKGAAYDVGKFAGDIGSFIGGGEGLEAARGASEAIPYLGKLAQSLGKEGLGSFSKRALGNAAGGAVLDPEDRTTGAIEGAALSGIGDIGFSALKSISPKSYMNNVYQGISRSLSNAKQESKGLYQPVMDYFGEQPTTLKGVDENLFLDPLTNSKVKSIYKDFKENPTISNAHKLQSQLGSAERGLKNNDIFTAGKKTAYQDARQQVLENIIKSLGSKYPEAADQYQLASQHYKDQVIPREMAHKAINKIVQPTPEKVLRKLESITKNDSYPSIRNGVDSIPLIPEDIGKLYQGLAAKVRNRNVAQSISGGIAGGALGHALFGPIGDLLGAAAGLSGAEKIFNPLNSASVDNLSKSIAKNMALKSKEAIKRNIRPAITAAAIKQSPLQIDITKYLTGSNQ